jgi:hypothetical protein
VGSVAQRSKAILPKYWVASSQAQSFLDKSGSDAFRTTK